MDCEGIRMDYPAAVSTPRPTTPSLPAAPIICSEFRRGRAYTNWRPRGTDDWLLILTVAGTGRIVVPDRTIRLQAGDAVLFAPGAAQDYATDQEAGWWHLRWAHFHPRPHWLPWLMWPQVAPKVGVRQAGDLAATPIASASQRMLTARRLAGPGWEDLAMNALEETLLWLFRLTGSTQWSGIDVRIQKAAHYLAAHPEEPFRLAKLAERCALSPSRFSHLFKAEMGVTPQRFSENLRLEFARHLLAQTNLSVSDIAAEVGFADPLYFSRRYRVVFGLPPTAARSTSAPARAERFFRAR
jgi:AraC family transcriptional regulator, arabinose operon regulatory protein